MVEYSCSFGELIDSSYKMYISSGSAQVKKKYQALVIYFRYQTK